MTEKTKTIELDPPVEWNNKSYTSLELREPTLDEMDVSAAEPTSFKMVKRLIADVAGVPQQVVGRLPVSKVAECSEFFEGFTPPSLKNGAT